MDAQDARTCIQLMNCFLQSLLPYTPILLWPAFGFLARDIAKAKGCLDIKLHMILGPFGYLDALAMPDLKSQMYLRKIAERYSLESELQAVLSTPKNATSRMSAR